MSGCDQSSAVVPEGLAGAAVSEQQVAEGRGRKQRSDCKVTDLQIYVAIVSHMGIVKSVALALGILRSTLYRRIERAPQLQACLSAARAVMVSIAWEQLDKALEAKARWATIFVVSRMHRVSMSSTWPRESYSTETSGAPAPRKKGTVSVAQPDVADASTLRLVRALENGAPWAIKYCLSHLDPNGDCGINQVRGRRDGQSENELEESLDEEQAEVEAEEAHDYELASRYAQLRHGVLTGKIQLPPAPPVVESEPEPVAREVAQPELAAPPLMEPESRTDAQSKITEANRVASAGGPRKVAESLRDSNPVDEQDAKACRLILDRELHPPAAPPVTDLKHLGSPGTSLTPNQPAGDSPRFELLAEDRHVDEPDAKAFRLILEHEAHPPVAPPVTGEDLDDKADDELFRQIRDMAILFKARGAPHVSQDSHVDKSDVDEFRRLLERGRARLPAAPSVTEAATAAEMPLPKGGVEQRATSRD